MYSGENIEVTDKRIVAGQTTFATAAVQTVWISKHSQLAPIAKVVGFLALLYGFSMMTCGGLVIGAISKDYTMEQWIRTAVLIVVGAIMLLIVSNRIPPFFFVVNATISGQQVGIYRTPSLTKAEEIQTAIKRAMELV